MSTSPHYVRTWILSWWSDPDGSGGTHVPPGTFPTDAKMEIVALDKERCSVAWNNAEGGPCSMALYYTDEQLKRTGFTLHLDGKDLYCQAAQLQQVVSDNGAVRVLVGFLEMRPDGGTGTAGTFVAQATPDPPQPPSAAG